MCRFMHLPVGLLLVTLIGSSSTGCNRDGSVPETAAAVALESPERVADGTDTVQQVVPRETESASQPSGEPGKLGIGDPAPPLGVAAWVKGEPIDSFQPGHVYVVEFWATWCPPCRDSMPHLSQLQEQYADEVSFVGISDEDSATVGGFLAGAYGSSTSRTWDEVVTYRLALDPDRVAHAGYMDAAAQQGIPTAFIVGREGHVEWIGHPMSMDDSLAKIVAGNWDRAAAAEQFRTDRAANEAKAALSALFRRAEQFGDFRPVLSELDRFLQEYPGHIELTLLKMQVLLHTEQFPAAVALGSELADTHWEDGQALDQIAWALAAVVPAEHRDLERALQVALRASSVQEDADSSALDTVARVYFEQGNVGEAIKWQKKAVDQAPGQEKLRATLERYEAAGGDAR